MNNTDLPNATRNSCTANSRAIHSNERFNPFFIHGKEHKMPKSFRLCAVALAAAAMLSAFAIAQDSDNNDAKKPNHTVKQVMEKAMSPKGAQLNKKVLSGKATDEEKLELLDVFISLGENDPPTGDVASWKAFTDAAMVAAAKAAVGRDDALAELKAATNCKKCHDAHKPAGK
jgi:hypothetical protein